MVRFNQKYEIDKSMTADRDAYRLASPDIAIHDEQLERLILARSRL